MRRYLRPRDPEPRETVAALAAAAAAGAAAFYLVRTLLARDVLQPPPRSGEDEAEPHPAPPGEAR